MVVLALACSSMVLVPAHRAAGVTPRGRAGRGLLMTVSLSKQEAAEEAYYRRWFWDQAEEAIDARFASASKRELKRVREYISLNREDAPLPKKLSKNPQYECIGGFFPGLTVTPFLDCSGQPWGGLAGSYPAIKKEMDALLAKEQARAAACSPRLASPRLAASCADAGRPNLDLTLTGVQGRGQAYGVEDNAHLLQRRAPARVPGRGVSRDDGGRRQTTARR